MKRTLDTITAGISEKILDLTGLPEFISRATSIGFCPGVHVTVLRNIKGYPMLVHLNDTQIAIDRIEAKKVMIDEC